MKKRITYQRIGKSVSDRYEVANRYYNMLSVLNDFKLTEREIQLVAFSAIRGSLSYANVRQDFCERYDTSGATINNMISRLKRLHIFIKENGKVKVNPGIVINFDNEIVLHIFLGYGKS